MKSQKPSCEEPEESREDRPRFPHATDLNRFPNFREITARFPSVATSCNHAIEKGDRIGWNRRTKATMCPHCWAEWVRENAAADHDERFLESQYAASL
jgi:hypothetical protein